MAKGMNEGQKVRTRAYLDEFKDKCAGCVICGRKVTGDYYFDPNVSDNGTTQLFVYASCAGHAMVSNSDDLLAEAVNGLRTAVTDEADEPVLMIVSFLPSGEEVKYAKHTK
jgi:hypothetical protein